MFHFQASSLGDDEVARLSKLSKATALRWRSMLSSDKVSLHKDPFWTYPHPFR